LRDVRRDAQRTRVGIERERGARADLLELRTDRDQHRNPE
jgi:hypothetical protein